MTASIYSFIYKTKDNFLFYFIFHPSIVYIHVQICKHTILQDPVPVAPWAPHAFEAGELRLQQEGQNHSTVVALHTRPQRLQHTHTLLHTLVR